MTVRPLDVSVNGVFDGTGVARVRIGPTVYGESWRLRRMTVNTTSSSDTDAKVFLNYETESRMVAGSYSGNRDFNETDMTLQTLDVLICVWTEGTPGANASLVLQGTKER